MNDGAGAGCAGWPAGTPAIGAPPAPEGRAGFPTGYYGTRTALAWLAG